MSYAGLFFAGAFLCNAIPHLSRGLSGAPFPTPFAKPRGVGNSSPLVNVVWGFFNVIAGFFLLSRHPVVLSLNPGLVAVFAGGIAIGVYLALHFGKVRAAKE